MVRKPVPLNIPWLVKEGWSLVVCQVQWSISGLVTWTKEKDSRPFQGWAMM